MYSKETLNKLAATDPKELTRRRNHAASMRDTAFFSATMTAGINTFIAVASETSSVPRPLSIGTVVALGLAVLAVETVAITNALRTKRAENALKNANKETTRVVFSRQASA